MPRPPTRFIHISDLQLGHMGEVTDNDRRVRRLVERVAAEEPDFVVHSGDHIAGAVNDDPAEAYRVQKMWADYHRAMTPVRARCPVISALGNHDQVGAAPSNEEYCRQTGRADKPTYYSTTIGAVHLIVLDVVMGRHRGGFPSGTAQARWLRRDLARPRRARCTVAVGHYPIFVTPWYYDGPDASLIYNEHTGAAGDLLPLLLDGGVDLYLCGHLHVYERSRHPRLTQLVAGAMEIAYPQLATEPNNQYCQSYAQRQTYTRFTLTDEILSGETIDIDGHTIDTWRQKLIEI